MKKSFLKVLILVVFLIYPNLARSQPINYSHDAITIYNSGVALHKQGDYEQAEKKYIQALKIQPNFSEAKKNLGIIYHNLANKYYSIGDYNKAIEYAQKSVKYNQEDIDCYNIMARSYFELNDFDNATVCYKKVISANPSNDSALHGLAQLYIKTKNYDDAANLYNKILSLNPSDNVARQNIKYVAYHKGEKILTESINNVQAYHDAPVALYKLIKPSAGITRGTVEKMENILDLIWSEPNGRIMLQGLINKKVPINITQGTLSANAMKQQRQNTLLLYGFIPIYSYKKSYLSVNIPFNYIADFYDPNIAVRQRIYCLHVFIHEFGHAFMNVKNPNHDNSIEEELGVSMLGYNSAYKIITGHYLTKEQTELYSTGTFESLLSDDHSKLPVFSGFNREIQCYGLSLPYPEIYSNLPLMYKTLLKEGKVRSVASFSRYVH